MPTVIWRGITALTEQPNSPEWQFGETITCHRTYRGPYSVCLSAAPGRGALGTGQTAGLAVSQSTVRRERGSIGVLEIEFGTNGTPIANVPLPPDTEKIQGDRQEFSLAQHPLFAPLPKGTLQDITSIIEYGSESDNFKAVALRLLNLNPTLKPLADKLALKLIRGQSHFLEYSPTYLRTSFHWEAPVNLSAGNKIETPVTINLFLPTGFLWLREADSVDFDGTFYRLEQKWIGSKEADPDIYPST